MYLVQFKYRNLRSNSTFDYIYSRADRINRFFKALKAHYIKLYFPFGI